CSTAIPPRSPGSAPSTATACARSGSSISGRPARSPTSIATTASTPTPSSRPPPPSPRAARSATSRRCRRVGGTLGASPFATRQERYPQSFPRDETAPPILQNRQHDRGDQRAGGDDRRIGQCPIAARPHQQRQPDPEEVEAEHAAQELEEAQARDQQE